MKIRNLIAVVLTTAVATGFSTFASAGALSCADATATTARTWSFNSAEACNTGSGNPTTSAQIEALGGLFDLGAANWAIDNTVSGAGDASAWLNISFASGTFGSKVAVATWTLATGFWETFGKAVFSVNVGNGNHEGLDDFGAFFITQGQTAGSWSFSQSPTTGNTGSGGELTNARLWTAGTGTVGENPAGVPEPGILLLLASGLLGLGFGKGRKAKA